MSGNALPEGVRNWQEAEDSAIALCAWCERDLGVELEHLVLLEDERRDDDCDLCAQIDAENMQILANMETRS